MSARALALRSVFPHPDLHLDAAPRTIPVHGRVADLVHDVHARHHLAEGRVLAFHRRLVGHDDEELGAAGVLARGPAGRGHGPAREGAVRELGLEQPETARPVAGRLARVLRERVAALADPAPPAAGDGPAGLAAGARG